MSEQKKAPAWGLTAAEDVVATPSPRPQKLWSVVGADTIDPLEVKYLWYPYVPQGRLTSVEGDPGIGKSWFTCALAAAISNGTRLPGDPEDVQRLPGKVLMLSSEDGLADTIVPRLISLGANLKNIFFPSVVFTLNEENIHSLAATMEHMTLAMVAIDPVQYYIGAKVDINRANEVRGFMGMLHSAAEKTNCAVILVRHLNKKGDGPALYRGLGSIDFAAALRSILHVSLGTDETRYVHHIKCNNAKEGETLTYTLGGEDGQEFEWGASLPRNFKVVAAKAISQKPRKQDLARELLTELLADGPKMYTEIITEAEKRGISEATVRLSRKGLTEAFKMSGNHGEWAWRLLPQTGADNDNEKLAGAEVGRGSPDTGLQGDGSGVGGGDGIREGEGRTRRPSPLREAEVRLGDSPPVGTGDAGQTGGNGPGGDNPQPDPLERITTDAARSRLKFLRQANAASI